MGVPNGYDLSGAKAAILGIPFDCGTHPVRIGARLGPSAIREQSALVRPYQPPRADFNPLERLGLIDCGDVNVTPSLILDAHARIEEAVWRIVSAGTVPVTMGGDGSVTLPQLRALHRKYPNLALLHIDAHTDTYPGEGEVTARYNTATTFTRAAEEGLLDTANSLHIGARGPIGYPQIFEHTRRCGYELIDGAALFARGFPETLHHIHARLANRPIYLCFDMDFFDPSCAPGVCTPAWGGASAREGLSFLQGLAGLNIVAADVNTVSPPHDVGGMTAFLAGTVVLECLTLVARALNLVNMPLSG
ncbi:MAG TPA: agmatinase [Alphaproteobacteria bacterium]|nr:agmatinase [Alphaproteobacteria bacterium]